MVLSNKQQDEDSGSEDIWAGPDSFKDQFEG